MVLAVFVALILQATCAVGQPTRPRDIEHEVSVLFNRAMKVATGQGGHVALSDKVNFDVPNGMIFVPREAADPLLIAAGRHPSADYIGIVLNQSAVGWFVTVHVVANGHVDADGMSIWTYNDVLASARDEQISENRRRADEGLPPLEIRRWAMRPVYNPLLHRLTWSAIVLPFDARPDAGGEIVAHAAQFGRNGYVRLDMTTVLDRLPQEAAGLSAIMDHVQYVSGETFADFIPNRDPTDPAGLAGVFGVEHLRKANFTTRLKAFGEPLIVPGGILGALTMAGGLLLFVYRWWRLQRPVR